MQMWVKTELARGGPAGAAVTSVGFITLPRGRQGLPLTFLLVPVLALLEVLLSQFLSCFHVRVIPSPVELFVAKEAGSCATWCFL